MRGSAPGREPTVRELVRGLTEEEWAILRPHLERAAQLQEQLKLLLVQVQLAERTRLDMLALLAGPGKGKITVDRDTHELYRELNRG